MVDEAVIREALARAGRWAESPATLQLIKKSEAADRRSPTLHLLRTQLALGADGKKTAERVQSFFAPTTKTEELVLKARNGMKSQHIATPSRHFDGDQSIQYNLDRTYLMNLLFVFSRHGVEADTSRTEILDYCQGLSKLVLETYCLSKYFNGQGFTSGSTNDHFKLLWGTSEETFSPRETFRALEALCAYRDFLHRANRAEAARALEARIMERYNALGELRVAMLGPISPECSTPTPLNTAYWLASYLVVRRTLSRPWPQLKTEGYDFEGAFIEDFELMLRQTDNADFHGRPFLPPFRDEGKDLPAGHTSYLETAAMVAQLCMDAIQMVPGLQKKQSPSLRSSLLMAAAKRTEEAVRFTLSCQDETRGGFSWNSERESGENEPTPYFSHLAVTTLARYLEYAETHRPELAEDVSQPLVLSNPTVEGSLEIRIPPEDARKLVRSVVNRSRAELTSAVVGTLFDPKNPAFLRRLHVVAAYVAEMGQKNGPTEADVAAFLAEENNFAGTWDQFTARHRKVLFKPGK